MDAIARHAYWVQIGMMAAFQSMPQLLQLCVFAAFYYLGGEFKASTVFVTIQLFDVLRIPVAQMPMGCLWYNFTLPCEELNVFKTGRSCCIVRGYFQQ